MFTDRELERIQDVASALASPVTLRLKSAGTGAQFETNLRNIARQMSGVSLNAIRFEDVIDSFESVLPFLSLVQKGIERIRYFSAPEGTELEPFLEAVKWMGSPGNASHEWEDPALGLEKDAFEIIIFIAPVCPHCPAMVRKCITLALEIPAVRLSVVDALHFAEWAQRFKVQATPTLVIDGGFTVVGNLGLEELRSYVLRRNEPDFTTRLLESMINSGRAEDAASFVCERNRPDALLPLFASPVFAQRMGALVVIEEALGRDQRIMDPIVEQLMALTSHEDAGIRGDTAELLGNIGDSRAIPALQKLQDDPDEDVREAAIEALEKLTKSQEEGL